MEDKLYQENYTWGWPLFVVKAFQLMPNSFISSIKSPNLLL